jgi:general secretion pathway protein B
MSLILEALRKSEAERRRAAVPDLLAEPQAAAPVAMRTSYHAPWIVTGAVLAAAIAWVALRDHPPAPLSVAPVERPTVVANQAPLQAQAQQPAPSRPAPPVRRPLVIAPPAPAPAKPVETQATAPKPERVAMDTPPPRIEPIAAATPPPAPAPASDNTERVTDLGGNERKQLPALKLSMHMWNDDAAQRFVIIDGARLRIGDHLGAVVVADILPDGVLLDWNGRALKLPLR